jgi:hypothetical protein
MLQTSQSSTYKYKGSSHTSKKKRRKITYTINDGSKDRLVHKVLRCFKGLTHKQIVEGTQRYNKTKKPVSVTTIRNWYTPVKDGGTRYPRAHTMDACLKSHGYELDIKDSSTGKLVE